LKFLLLLDNELMIIFTVKVGKPKRLQNEELLRWKARSRLLLGEEGMFQGFSGTDPRFGIHGEELVDQVS
jgi:hypothetical protein